MNVPQQLATGTMYADRRVAEVNALDTAIVVIGRNEGQRLVVCLASLGELAQRTIYVDSGSRDGSPEAALAMHAHVVDLDMREPFTAARARNAGYDKAIELWPDLHFVQFVDGDCAVDPDWLREAWRLMQMRPDVAITFGRRRERHPERSVYNALCDDEWDGPPGEALECGGDIFVRRQAFDQAGGYRPQLIAGEEPELCVRLRDKGWKIWRIDHEMTLHDADITTLRQWWRRTKRAGHAFAEVATLHRHSPNGIWRRNMSRSIVWGGVMPALIVAGSLLHPAALAALAIYPAQVARIAAGQGFSRKGWRDGFFSVLGKFAEFQGAASWAVNRIRGRRQAIIEYK